MTQHMIMSTRKSPNGLRILTACGREVGTGQATSWQQTTCRACMRSLAWRKASEK